MMDPAVNICWRFLTSAVSRFSTILIFCERKAKLTGIGGVAAHEVAERTEQCHECQACQQTADCELEQPGRGPGTKRRGQMLASKN